MFKSVLSRAIACGGLATGAAFTYWRVTETTTPTPSCASSKATTKSPVSGISDYLRQWSADLSLAVDDPNEQGMSIQNKGKFPTHDQPFDPFSSHPERCAKVGESSFVSGLEDNTDKASNPYQVVIKTESMHEDGRIIVVGDVQGCYAEYTQLMELVKLNTDKDRVVLLGDIVFNSAKKNSLGAKGSVEILRHAKANRDIITVIRGNHELGLQLNLETRNAAHWSAGVLDNDDLAFLQSLPMQVHVPMHNILCVHAGIDESSVLAEQRYVVSTKLRMLVMGDDKKSWWPTESNWKSRDPDVPWDKSIPWAKHWGGPEHVVFGHDARKGLQLWPFATGLDTGASGKYDDGALTAMVLPSRKEMKKIDNKQAGNGFNSRRARACDPFAQDRPGQLLSVPYVAKKYRA